MPYRLASYGHTARISLRFLAARIRIGQSPRTPLGRVAADQADRSHCRHHGGARPSLSAIPARRCRRTLALRTLLVVPMLKDEELIGAIAIYRQEVRPFTDKQIELVRTSPPRPSSPSRTPACSASCANSLQQQTATADVLKVISQLARRAAAGARDHAGESADAHVRSGQVRQSIRLRGRCTIRCAASYGVPAGIRASLWQREPLASGAGNASSAALSQTTEIVHVPDVHGRSGIHRSRSGWLRSLGRRIGRCSIVPLLEENELIGVIDIYRQEVRPFTDKQIELVDDLRRPGGDRDRERAAVRRGAGAHARAHRIAGAADRDLGGARGHQQLACRTASRCSRPWPKAPRGCARPTSLVSPLRRRAFATVGSFGHAHRNCMRELGITSTTRMQPRSRQRRQDRAVAHAAIVHIPDCAGADAGVYPRQVSSMLGSAPDRCSASRCSKEHA